MRTSSGFLSTRRSHGLLAWLWLHRPQAEAKANLKPRLWLGLAFRSQGFGFMAFWLQAKPSTSLIVVSVLTHKQDT
ncbi:hypothetical protein B0H10DRAFT_2115023 [Mycena sp. CBHHK59/15]|nr:hypothetical protein B0H10DRAFT_2115023 [Mycena sp. CBHHK59/15]